MTSPELSEVKLVIKGLIASSPHPLTLLDLNRDYAKEEGRSIPFYKFGFNNLLEFVRSIKDTVRVENRYGDSSNPIISLVVSEKSEHVVSLVDRQNKKKRRPSRTCRPIPFYTAPRSSVRHYRAGPPPSYDLPPRFQPKPTQQYVPQSTTKKQPEPPVVAKSPSSGYWSEGLPLFSQAVAKSPATEPAKCSSKLSNEQNSTYVSPKLELQIINIVKENPGISPKDLETAVHKEFRFDILNCCNGINEVLKSLHKKLHVTNDKIYLSGFSDTNKHDKEERTYCDTKQSMLPAGYIEDGYACETDSVDIDGGFSSEDDDLPPLKPGARSLCSGEGSQIDRGSHISESRMSERLKSQLFQLLQKFPKGIWCWELPEYYMNEYGVPLDCQQVGYVSVSQMMRSVPDLFRCELIDGMDCKVYDATQPSAPETAISSTMVDKIKILVAKSHRGIDEENFCKKFQEVYHTEFNFKNMGFPTLHSLFEALDGEVIHLVRIANRYRICPLTEKETVGDFESLIPSLSKEEEEEFLKLFPRNVCGPMESIKRVEFPKTTKRGSYLEVIVAEISGPHNFWAQLRGQEYHIQLGKTMDEMEAFYMNASNRKKYALPEEAIMVGLHCVAEYAGAPHRCRILKVDSPHTVKIIYVDFGTIATVNKSSLLFLHRRFLDFPSQAFRCTLHNLKPANNNIKFPRAVGERLLELVMNKGLVAHVASVDAKALTMSLILIDTSGQDDICVNDVLVEEGHAEYCCVDIDLVQEAIKECEVRSSTPQVPTINSVAYQEPETLYDMRSESEEQVLTRCPAAILSNTRRKIRTPPGFSSKEPSGFSSPPLIQTEMNSSFGHQESYSLSSSPVELNFEQQHSGLSSPLGHNVDSGVSYSDPHGLSSQRQDRDTGFNIRQPPGLSPHLQHNTSTSVPSTTDFQQTCSPQSIEEIDVSNSSRYRETFATTNVRNEDLTYLLSTAVRSELMQQEALKQVQSTLSSYAYRQQYPANVAFMNNAVPSMIVKYSTKQSEQANLNDLQTEYLRKIMQKPQAVVYPGYLVNTPPLNPLAAAFVPPATFVPLVPTHQNPQNSYDHRFSNYPSMMPPWQQHMQDARSFNQQVPQSSFDKFFNSPIPDPISELIQKQVSSESLKPNVFVEQSFRVPTTNTTTETDCSEVRISAKEQYCDVSSTLSDSSRCKVIEVSGVYHPQNASPSQCVTTNNSESKNSSTAKLTSQSHSPASNELHSKQSAIGERRYSSSTSVGNNGSQSDSSSVVERSTFRHTTRDNEMAAIAVGNSGIGYQSHAGSSVLSRNSSRSSLLGIEDRVPGSDSSSVDISDTMTENMDTVSNELQEMTLVENSRQDNDMNGIKAIMAVDEILHVINVDGLWHLITDELLKIKDYKKNVAMKILKSRNVQLEVLELKESTHPSIFSELSRNPNVELKSSRLHVVRYDSVPKLLTELKYPENYIIAIQDEMKMLLTVS